MHKPYNATLVSRDADGKVVSTTIARVEDGLIVEAAGYWSHSIGTAAYDADWRGSRFSFVADVEVVLDGGELYKSRLSGLALPPAYARAAEVSS